MQERAAANWRTFDSASIEYHPDDVITDKAELLTPVYLMTTLMPNVPTATGCSSHTNTFSQLFQGFVTKFRCVLLAWIFSG